MKKMFRKNVCVEMMQKYVDGFWWIMENQKRETTPNQNTHKNKKPKHYWWWWSFSRLSTV